MRCVFVIILCPILGVLTVVEWLMKLGVKLSTVTFGMLFDVLLVCMVIALYTKQWESAGLLMLVAIISLGIVYGNATILFLVGEMKSMINRWRGV